MKKIAFVYLLLIMANKCFTQIHPTILWQKAFGGSDIDIVNGADFEYGKNILQSQDGGYLISGQSSSGISGVKNSPNIGYDDIWLLKINQMGEIIWQKSIGSPGNDFSYFISETKNGDYLIGGLLDNKSTVFRLNNNGDSIWQKEYDLSDTKYICEAENGIYLFGDKDTDFKMIFLNDNGEVQWEKSFGSDFPDRLTAVDKSKDGFVLGVISQGLASGDKTEDSYGANDYWIMELDTVGNIIWQNNIGGIDEDIIGDVIALKNGGYVVSGISISNIGGDKSENGYGSSDIWTLKLDSIGNIVWQKTLGGSDFESFPSFVEDDKNNLIGVCWSYSKKSGNKSDSSKAMDIWLMKLTSNGEIIEDFSIGGADSDEPNTLIINKNGNVVVLAESASNISYDKSEDSYGQWDYWIVELDVKSKNQISCQAFIDNNLNGSKDIGEAVINQVNFKISSSNGSKIFANPYEEYFTLPVDTGRFSVSVDNIPNFSVFNNHILIEYNEYGRKDTVYFALRPRNIFDATCVSIASLNPTRLGSPSNLFINYQNEGTQVSNGNITFIVDGRSSFLSAQPAPNRMNGDTLVWDFSQLSPLEARNITLFLKNDVPPILSLGDTLTHLVFASPHFTELGNCNQAKIQMIITGPFDPNDKSVNLISIKENELDDVSALTYVIRFQNVGNDTAFFVGINDTLDDFLIADSIKLIAASHPVAMQVDGNVVVFSFVDIALPDSSTNLSSSNGYVVFSTKCKNILHSGDKILNQASIVFDFNEPISTNIVETNIIHQITGIYNYTFHNILEIFPNPTNGKIYLKMPELGESQFFLFDVMGKEIYSELINCQDKMQVIDFNFLNLPSQVLNLVVKSASGKIYSSKIVLE